MSNKQLNWDKLPTGVLVGLILIVVLTMFAIYYGIMEHNTKVKPSDNITAEAYEEVVYTSVEEVAEKNRIWYEETEEQPQILTDIHSLDNEWFETHAAIHRFILKSDMRLYEIFQDEAAINEGSYSISNGKIIMHMNNGTEYTGVVRADNNYIYLDLDCGWYITVDPSDRTTIQMTSKQRDYSWMNGEWYLVAEINDPYVGTLKMHTSLFINTKSKTMKMIDEDYGEVECNGHYTIDEDENTISCCRVYVCFDPSKKKFYEEYQGRRTYYYKQNSWF